jgi:hypothetical protein
MEIGKDGRRLKQKKNEAGKVISGGQSKKSMYAEWKKKTQARVQTVGETEDLSLSKKTPKPPKVVAFDDDQDDHDDQDKKKTDLKTIRKYHGKLDAKDLTNKQRRKMKRSADAQEGRVTSRGERGSTVKDVGQIAKNRKLEESKKMLQNPKTRKQFSKQSKDKYLEKKRGEWQNRSRGNARSRVIERRK